MWYLGLSTREFYHQNVTAPRKMMTIGMLGACYFKTNPYIIGMSQGSDARGKSFFVDKEWLPDPTWLVVSNIFIFHNIWDNPPHWLIFFRGVDTTNQQQLGKNKPSFRKKGLHLISFHGRATFCSGDIWRNHHSHFYNINLLMMSIAIYTWWFYYVLLGWSRVRMNWGPMRHLLTVTQLPTTITSGIISYSFSRDVLLLLFTSTSPTSEAFAKHLLKILVSSTHNSGPPHHFPSLFPEMFFLWNFYPGWWFGTWIIFFHSVGNVIIPTDELHFLEG